MSTGLIRLARKQAGAYTAGTDLSMDNDNGIAITTVTPKERACALRFTIATSVDVVMYVRHNGVNIAMNGGTSIGADVWRTFTLGAGTQDPISIRFSLDCTVRLILIEEVNGGVV